jgi:hypothetical protein
MCKTQNLTCKPSTDYLLGRTETLNIIKRKNIIFEFTFCYLSEQNWTNDKNINFIDIICNQKNNIYFCARDINITNELRLNNSALSYFAKELKQILNYKESDKNKFAENKFKAIYVIDTKSFEDNNTKSFEDNNNIYLYVIQTSLDPIKYNLIESFREYFKNA